MKKIKIKKKKFHTSVTRCIVFAVFALYAIILVIPYIYGFLVSIKTRGEYLNNPVFSLPETFNLINYVTAWTELSASGAGFIEMFANSLWYSVGRVGISLIFSSMSAYVVAKYRFPGRKLIYTITIVTMMIPLMGTMASNLQFDKMLGAYNSPFFVVIESQALGGVFIILYSTFKSVSWGYAEAAFVDGAGNFRVYLLIMMPQIISALTALFLSEFIIMWTDSATPLIYLPDLPTLASGLFLYQEDITKEMNYPVFFAGLITCMIPTIALFIAFQDKLMDLQLGGGLKG